MTAPAAYPSFAGYRFPAEVISQAPDARTQALRRQVTRRNQIVRRRVRLKAITQLILHAHLLPQCPHANLFGNRCLPSGLMRQLGVVECPSSNALGQRGR